MKKIATGIVGALTLAGGGSLTADRVINPYEDTGAKLEIAAESVTPDAGEMKVELSKERPEITLKKWNGEAALTVSYEKVKAEGSRAFMTDRMEWKDGNEEVHAYPLEATEQMEDGGFEIEVILNAPPESNVFSFKIEGAEALDFFYQPPLNLDPPEGEMCVSTRCWDVNEETTTERLENVVGSFAVYHKERANHIEGEKNYATGKAYHIFRPKAVDADGNETWAELTYAGGVLSVTVPEKFLASAIYPVRVDPTFGYTSIGASVQAISSGTDSTYFGMKSSGLLSGTLDSVSAAIRMSTAPVSDTQRYALSTSQPVPFTVFSQTLTSSITTTFAFYTRTAASQSFSGNPVYAAVQIFYTGGAGNIVHIAYDSGVGVTGFTVTGDTSTYVDAPTRSYSVYATYSDIVPGFGAINFFE